MLRMCLQIIVLPFDWISVFFVSMVELAGKLISLFRSYSVHSHLSYGNIHYFKSDSLAWMGQSGNFVSLRPVHSIAGVSHVNNGNHSYVSQINAEMADICIN